MRYLPEKDWKLRGWIANSKSCNNNNKRIHHQLPTRLTDTFHLPQISSIDLDTGSKIENLDNGTIVNCSYAKMPLCLITHSIQQIYQTMTKKFCWKLEIVGFFETISIPICLQKQMIFESAQMVLQQPQLKICSCSKICIKQLDHWNFIQWRIWYRFCRIGYVWVERIPYPSSNFTQDNVATRFFSNCDQNPYLCSHLCQPQKSSNTFKKAAKDQPPTFSTCTTTSDCSNCNCSQKKGKGLADPFVYQVLIGFWSRMFEKLNSR